MPRIAITRAVSSSLDRCEISHLDRKPIDVQRARQQHAEYEACLRQLGCSVLQLPEEPELPDAVFVEDTAIVLPELAVITRPGAESRRPEVTSVAEALTRHRLVRCLEAPATLDGGDVILVGKQLLVGRTERTTATGVGQLQEITAPQGYTVQSIDVSGCLHLKSAATYIGRQTLLLNPQWVAPEQFESLHHVCVHPDEPYAANAVLVGEELVFADAFPRTAELLEEAGFSLHSVDASELAKAEGALTCCSLLIEE